jgi:DNA polymerase III gamma/tau subunit
MHQILKAHIGKREFHHAYLLCGDGEAGKKMAEEAARAILAEDNLESHPDFSRGRFGLFGIKDSHNLTSWAATKSFSGQGKVLVMEVFSFNMESSNALLKTLEEPGEKIHFFIIVPSVDVVIPTLRSRLTIIDLSSDKEELEKKLLETGRKFLAALPNKRLEIIKKLSAKSDDENELLSESSANKQKAIQFLNALEFLLHLDIECPSGYPALEELSRSRQFISDRGASAKMILEHLALALPILK